MNDLPENQAAEPSVAETAKEHFSLRRYARGFFTLAAVAAIGLGYSIWALRHWNIDPAPLPRPWHNAPYITTPLDVVDAMLEAAAVKEDDVLYDLGCGDGRIAVVAAEKFGCRSVGFDIEPDRIRDSRVNAQTHGVEKLATFEQKDVLTLDLRQADVVAIYLLPRFMTRMIPQFQQMRPGARIISHDFTIEGVPPDKTIHMDSQDDEKDHYIFVWTTPLKIPPP